MAVGLVLSPGTNVVPCLPYVGLIAKERRDSIVVLWPQRRSEETKHKSECVATAGDTCPPELETVFQTLRELGFSDSPPTEETLAASTSVEAGAKPSQHPDSPDRDDTIPTLRCEAVTCPGAPWSRAVLEQLVAHDVTHLVVPRPQDLQHTSAEFEDFRQLATEANCEVIQLRATESKSSEASLPTSSPSALPKPLRVLVAAAPGPSAEMALARAYDWAEVVDAELTAIYVEPDIDEAAVEVGEKIVNRVVRRALGSHGLAYQTRVVLASDIDAGIAEIAGEYDLLVLGTQNHGLVHRLLHRGIPQELLRKAVCPAVAVLRPATSLTSRVASSLDRFVRDLVPQLIREQRVSLVDRIQTSSKWDVDFVALISLSTLIATCGLLQNSTAVVIGAMLVAPLMTPLLGAGLSLVQGNEILFRNAFRSVLRGFLLALILAVSIGCLVRSVVNGSDVARLITDEIAARGSPRLLDLIVAFVSGVAAAYATSRPNLLSALPGVAIASALVPPIGTIGLGLAWQQWRLASGAAMLFVTNIVAIVLGTAISFFAVGVRGKHSHSFVNSGTKKTVLVLVIALLALGVIESLPARRVPLAMQERIIGYFEGKPTIQLQQLRWKNPDSNILQVHVVSPSPLLPSVGRDVTALANQVSPREVHVELLTQLVSFHQPSISQRDDSASAAAAIGRISN